MSVPLTIGTAVLVGADNAACTTAVAVELAEAVPWLLVAVTTATIVCPTSLAASV